MRTYTVHELPGGQTDRLERAESLVFVEDGFSWAAGLFTPFWMIAHKLWLGLLAYLAGAALLQLVIWLIGLPQGPASWVWLAVHVIIGFEADSIRRWSLSRRGYDLIGSVSGRRIEDCERRFFNDWLKGQPFLQSGPSSASTVGRGGEGRLGALAFDGRRA